jgi:AraC family transcriptional regulator, ethanolamine operon transcriptional activator
VRQCFAGSTPEERLADREALTTNPTCCRALWSHLVGLLDLAEAWPDVLTQPEAVQRIEQECIRRFVGVITRSSDDDRTECRPSNRERLVRRAEDYLRDCLAESLSVLDLCRELAVSERTLHYAFQEVRGLSPMAYFKAKRLNAVRQELKAAGADSATVHEIAQRWGFWHTGEFAADYRRLFGELPSETLGRRAAAAPTLHE